MSLRRFVDARSLRRGATQARDASVAMRALEMRDIDDARECVRCALMARAKSGAQACRRGCHAYDDDAATLDAQERATRARCLMPMRDVTRVTLLNMSGVVDYHLDARAAMRDAVRMQSGGSCCQQCLSALYGELCKSARRHQDMLRGDALYALYSALQ